MEIQSEDEIEDGLDEAEEDGVDEAEEIEEFEDGVDDAEESANVTDDATPNILPKHIPI